MEKRKIIIEIDLENLWKLQKIHHCWLINFEYFKWSYILADNKEIIQQISQNATLSIEDYILKKINNHE